MRRSDIYLSPAFLVRPREPRREFIRSAQDSRTLPDIIDARDAENESRKQRIGLAHFLRIDELKAQNSADIMVKLLLL